MQKVIQRVKWSPSTYRNFKEYISYFPYTHPIFNKITTLPPIVAIQKIERAKELLKNCQEGKSAFLHIGDCAEPFEHATSHILAQKIAFMKDCQSTMNKIKKKTTHIIGRIAGQYAKPRSSQFVEINGVKTHNYKGDNINGMNENDRNPCESKLLQGYNHSLNASKQIQQQFSDLFVSHEGLVLPYEESQTKEINGKHYCQSAHMIWIGERTRQIDGAHVQFFRGLENPIGVKISSNVDLKEFTNLVNILNPNNEKGKLLIIVRMGKDKIKSKLQDLIKIKQNQGLNFLFVTDPMHANTYQAQQTKLKTRSLDHILEQIKYFQQKMNDSKLSHGYSLQATFQDVTQCYGLEFPFKQKELKPQAYKSKCDPRLNRAQTLRLLQLLSTH